MEIFQSLAEYNKSLAKDPIAKSAVTLGKFDGVHIGHLKLIRKILRRAKENHLKSVVFAIQSSDDLLLSSLERQLYLESLGVDILIECPFSKEFKSLHAEEFVQRILSGTLHASYVAVGEDYAFGYNREGNTASLTQYGLSYGFETEIVSKEQYLGIDVSSSRVREAVKNGDMELASRLLGRPYPITGTVTHGRHIGSTIGVPTANVVPVSSKILPPDGVYATLTKLPDGSIWKGMTNLGCRPTVGGVHRRAETTLFDYSGNLYGSLIETSLISYIRAEQKFADLQELKDQINLDQAAILEVLSKSP